jgi:hypothetical protein
MRERLFALLDSRREHPMVWLSAGPGAGKTTLVASWLAARRVEGLWYQFDAGDADPATFFHYLRLALRAALPRARLPPLPTPEYLPDLEGFSRRWFRELFHRLPLGAACVFDNCHEVGPESALHRVVAYAGATGGGTAKCNMLKPPPDAQAVCEVTGAIELK